MKKTILICYCLLNVLFLLLFFSNIGYTQTIIPSFEFKVQYMETDNFTWGVYTRPTIGFEKPSIPIIGVGQITLLMPKDMTNIVNIKSVTGNWKSTPEQINSPKEAPAFNYFFIGLNSSSENVPFENDKETLLFTFQLTACPDSLGLIDNNTDPFNKLPNSENTNPGMDLGVYNPENGNIYNWKGNYAPTSFSCNSLSTPVKETSFLQSLKIYPNPAQEQLYLEWGSNHTAQFSISDLSGRTIVATQDLRANQRIDINSISTGIYLIKIISEGKIFYSKFGKM